MLRIVYSGPAPEATSSPLHVGVPRPQSPSAPEELAESVVTALNLLAWAGTAAGVIGVLVTGTVMAISQRRGDGGEHMGRLGWVMAGCVLVASAGPIVSWFFSGAFSGGASPAATSTP
ncbi:hypothetical protein ACFQ1L_33600 [Phytohabitans flavus]|nr:hypothetical protein [Phytohabitans flavus]